MRGHSLGNSIAREQPLRPTSLPGLLSHSVVGEGREKGCPLLSAQVEEVSAAVNDKKNEAKSTDPMDKFCENNEDADECRVYGERASQISCAVICVKALSNAGRAQAVLALLGCIAVPAYKGSVGKEGKGYIAVSAYWGNFAKQALKSQSQHVKHADMNLANLKTSVWKRKGYIAGPACVGSLADAENKGACTQTGPIWRTKA
eukprot:1158614-Pelagomonas_calceolata.AAC.1